MPLTLLQQSGKRLLLMETLLSLEYVPPESTKATYETLGEQFKKDHVRNVALHYSSHPLAKPFLL